MTDRAECIFTVKEFEGGQPFLACEILRGNLPSLGRKLLTFDVRNGMSLDEAKSLAETLNEQITHVAIT